MSSSPRILISLHQNLTKIFLKKNKKQNIRIDLTKEKSEKFKYLLNMFIIKTGNVHYMQRKDILHIIFLEMIDDFIKLIASSQQKILPSEIL